ncbi:autotransporter outer membrane beta-barrel domain-containing protein [Photobacterium profundum]|uniref:autotransporter outer membrane beta-barrel domain-containing protein n=1 Tax=Photobacterium profundum TaxID=74109 RepID=UPI003D0FAED6
MRYEALSIVIARTLPIMIVLPFCAISAEDSNGNSSSVKEDVYAVISTLMDVGADIRGDKFTHQNVGNRSSSINKSKILQQKNLNTADLTERASSVRNSTKNPSPKKNVTPKLTEVTFYQDGFLGTDNSSRLGAYVRFEQDKNTIEQQTLAAESNPEREGYSVTLGGDYLLNEKYLFGVALGLPFYDSGLENAESEIDGLVASGYFSYFQDQWYMDFTASYALVDTDIERKISHYSDNVINNSDDADSDIWVFSFGGGYVINQGYWNIALESTIQHTLSDSDRYTERPSRGNSNYLISKVDDVDNLESTMLISGASFSHSFRSSLGIFQPYLRSYVHYDFDSSSEKVISQLKADNSGMILPIIINSDDQLYGRAHLGVSSVFNNGWHGFAEASTLIGLDDLDAYTFTLGVGIPFN